MSNEMYPIHSAGFDESGHFAQREDWAFTCGHCTTVVVMHPLRTRPRQTCMSCGRWICENNQLCNVKCTPMYAMGKDHFQNTGKHGQLVNAIMAGETNLEAAQKKGLIIGDING